SLFAIEYKISREKNEERMILFRVQQNIECALDIRHVSLPLIILTFIGLSHGAGVDHHFGSISLKNIMHPVRIGEIHRLVNESGAEFRRQPPLSSSCCNHLMSFRKQLLHEIVAKKSVRSCD